MNCTSLFEFGVRRFQAKLAEYFDNKLPVFLHVPKTAGSSVARDLHKSLGNGHVIDWENVWESTATFACTAAPNIRFLRGHLDADNLEYLAQQKIAIAPFTYLRDPVSRVISNYRYCVSSISPKRIENRRRYPSLSHFVSENLQPNHVTRLLVGTCQTVDEAIEKIATRYCFVGVQEHYSFCQSILIPALGGNYEYLPRVNVTPPDESIVIRHSEIEQLIETQKIDQKVFQYFQNKYQELQNQPQSKAA